MTPGITTRTTPTTGTEASEVSMCGADEGSLSRRTDKGASNCQPARHGQCGVGCRHHCRCRGRRRFAGNCDQRTGP